MSKNNVLPTWHNLDSGKADYGSTPPGESFKKCDSLIRETVQNSIDARAGEKPVVIDFDCFNLKDGNDLPDLSEYKLRLRERESQKNRIENNRWLDQISSFVNSKRTCWRVLRIGDHNTVGLDYLDENGTSETGTWHKLVRAQNSSSKINQEGGSFGLGSGAHSVGSRIYMVFYGSRSLKNKDYHFQGVAHLGSIINPEDSSRFCDSRVFFGVGLDGWEPSLSAPAGFPERGEDDFGTDVFIIEPRLTTDFINGNSEHTNNLKTLIWQFIFNFAPAIRDGVVQARFMQNGTTLSSIVTVEDASSYLEQLLELPEEEQRNIFSEDNFNYELASASFLLMFFQNQLLKRDVCLKGGKVADLWLQIDENAKKVVYAVRRIGMRVESPWQAFRNLGQVSWLINIHDSGYNKHLRELESPDHLSWTNNSSTDSGALNARKELRKAVRQIIEEELKKTVQGDEMPISDLGALMSKLTGGEIVETDLKLRPIKFTRTQTSNNLTVPSGNTNKVTEEGGIANQPKPHRQKSHTKRTQRIGSLGGTNKVFIPVNIRDRIIAVDPSKGDYLIKFTPDQSWERMNISLYFNPDGGFNSTPDKNLSLCPEAIIHNSGCFNAKIDNGKILLTGLCSALPVKLVVRIKEKLMSSLRVIYYVQ
mgnify:CR=1 FL=1